MEKDDKRSGRRRTNRAGRERKGILQGAPISPLFSNTYMRRFSLSWKVLDYARRFKAEIVNYADDFAVLGRAPAAEMLTAVEGLRPGAKAPETPPTPYRPRACPRLYPSRKRPEVRSEIQTEFDRRIAELPADRRRNR